MNQTNDYRSSSNEAPETLIEGDVGPASQASTADLSPSGTNSIRTASNWAMGLGLYYLVSGLLALYFISKARRAPIELWVLEAGVLYTGIHMLILGRRLRRTGGYGLSDLNTLVRVYIIVGLLYVIGFVLFPGFDIRLLIGILLYLYALNVTIKGRRMMEELEGKGDEEERVSMEG